MNPLASRPEDEQIGDPDDEGIAGVEDDEFDDDDDDFEDDDELEDEQEEA